MDKSADMEDWKTENAREYYLKKYRNGFTSMKASRRLPRH
jgi:hypothetical protein